MTSRFGRWALLILVALLMAACGGGGADTSAGIGIGGTGKTASGSITGFGSIFVNGVEYATDGAQIIVDDTPGHLQSDLRIGMVVTVVGSAADATGIAEQVSFETYLAGPLVPVAGQFPGPDLNTKTFDALGVRVNVDATGTVFETATPAFDFDTLADGDIVAVSGFIDDGGTLQASWIRREGNLATNPVPSVKLKGQVSGASATGFYLGPVRITTSPSTDFSDIPGGVVGDGMFVDVRGTYTNATAIDASGGRVALHSLAVGDDGDAVSLEGIVAAFGGVGSFQVAGRAVDASGATLQPASMTLADGVKVEVEGTISGGVLVAASVESRADTAEVHGRIGSVNVTNAALNEGTISVPAGDGTIVAVTDRRTSFADLTGADADLKLTDLGATEWVEMRGYVDGGTFVASEVRRAGADEVLVQGPVESFSFNASITLLGVTYTTGGGTEFETINDTSYANSTAFYNDLDIGDLVKIEDEAPFGTADEVEFQPD